MQTDGLSAGGLVWRAIFVAGGFLGAQVGAGAVLTGLGLQESVDLGVDPTLMLVAVGIGGLLIGGTLGPLARRVPGSRRTHAVVWSALIFLNMAGVVLEGAFFAPDLAPMENLPAGLIAQFVAAVVTAGLVAWLFVPARATGNISLRDRPWASWMLRVLAGALLYVVLFFVVGGLNYQLVTGSYYEAQIDGLVTPAVGVILVLEFVRGLLIVLSVLPFVRAFTGDVRQRALYAGGLLFVFSGLVPLLFQLFTFPPFLLFASGYEILLQVGPTGVAVAYLLGPHGTHG